MLQPTAEQLAECGMTAEERWFPIPDWSSYEVSDYGQVRSKPVQRMAGRAGLRWTKGKILKQTNSYGHVTVSLYEPGRKKWTAGVASVVLRAIVGPPPEGQEARHFYDPNPFNNALWNLCWGTHSDNVLDELRHYGKHHSKGVPRSEETKAKIGEANRGHVPSEETRQKIREANTGHVVSEEAKAKMSESQKRRWAKTSKKTRSLHMAAAVEAAAAKRRGRWIS